MTDVPRAAVQRQIIALIPVYMNSLMIGSATGWMSNAVYFLLAGEEVHATSSQCALIASFSEVGRVAFAIPAGMLADKYGRKNSILSVAILHFFAWLGLSLSTSIYTIYIARFIIGSAQAVVNATTLISVGEIASPQIRGTLTSIYQIFMNIGPLIPSIISILFSSYKSLGWSITIFSILTLLSMFWATETPSYLITVLKLKQAKTNLQRIRQGYPENDINKEFEQLQKYIEDEKTRKNRLSWVKFLQSKPIRKPMLIGILTNLFAVSTGSFIIRTYITVIIPSDEIIPSKYYPLICQLLILIVSSSTPLYIEKFPRRSILLVGAASVMVINACSASSQYFMMEYQNEYVFKWIFIVGNILVIAGYSLAIQPMTNTINSELYPQAIKGFCGSLVIISQATSLIISYQLYNLIDEYFQLYVMYAICSFNCMMLYLVVYFFIPEGRGAFLSDLQMKFNDECVPNESTDVEKNSQK